MNEDDEHDFPSLEDTLEMPALVIKECFVYRIPREQMGRDYYANQWGLDKPLAVCELHASSLGKTMIVRYARKKEIPADAKNEKHKTSTGKNNSNAVTKTVLSVVATQRVEFNLSDPKHPSATLEPYFFTRVKDSSRYFAIRIHSVDKKSGKSRSQIIGMGFRKRDDAFNYVATLQDHYKYVIRTVQAEKNKIEDATTTSNNIDSETSQEQQMIKDTVSGSSSGSSANLTTPPSALSKLREESLGKKTFKLKIPSRSGGSHQKNRNSTNPNRQGGLTNSEGALSLAEHQVLQKQHPLQMKINSTTLSTRTDAQQRQTSTTKDEDSDEDDFADFGDFQEG
eukprot:g2241.t1